MRISELSGKEIIHLETGKRLGVVGHTDLLFNEETGEVESLIIPHGSIVSWGKGKKETIIDWKDIETIGQDMILIHAQK
ncbi:YlmC/YmxH family sporulation protein [Bacillus taeanensis]|uniref:YlmC/YmxH family sporulation protein n=1 Tax=Bacillus taeanensis TaxID=273032 RepID=A0A366Y0G9_9BACI|nr:YlmC/YmxH family sporulation protein [Bacillus taeanensis]RBW69893.1 YlmC/YmxH family sporulation protein [Bacillus taeanensis]